MKAQQSGFTLIELVMVIVILGILAATAAPKFLNLQSDARAAAVDGMAGALKSAAAIVHTACLLDATCDETAATDTTTIDGATMNVVYGWPAAGNGTGDIKGAADITLGKFAETATSPYTLQLNSSTTCQVTYTNATATAAATVASATAGC